MREKIKTSLFFGVLMVMPSINSFAVLAQQPKLILQITVDQLRADLPKKYRHHMGGKGFNYLYNSGVEYLNANHLHANTETIVGHTTLATGATPAIHGMVGNIWYNRSLNRLVYNVEDENFPILSKNADVDKNVEIDPTQKKARSSGRSPVNINVSTFSDELALFTANKAKIFSVSVKDRSAIAMAGHKGKAFWFSKSSGDFITSSYYYDTYPSWVSAWNNNNYEKFYENTAWSLSLDKSKYLMADKDEQAGEVKFPLFNNIFPHHYGDLSNKYFNTFLTLSPAGDELTVKFAKSIIEEENLGADDITDYLSVSLSSTDYVGHVFGPSSLEMEDNLIRLDKSLANLLNYVHEKVGLENTLIVLSADHGGADTVAANQSNGLTAKHVALPDWKSLFASSSLKNKVKDPSSVLLSYSHPYVYLDHKKIKQLGLDLKDVQQELADILSKNESIEVAIPSYKIKNGIHPNNSIYRSIANNYNEKRSGDIHLVFKPNYFINDMDGLKVAAHHGSPWRYDTHVPIIFSGKCIESKQVTKNVSTLDISTTLAAIIGTKMPSGSTGNILTEAINTLTPNKCLPAATVF